MTSPDRFATKEIHMQSHDADSSSPQPDPGSSSDGDGSWTEDPVTQDPDQDRSVEHVIEQTREYGDGDATDEG
jgi:hypothetical protein